MEDILNSIGPFGKYQKFVLILAGFVTSLTAITIYSTIFSAVDPGLICTFKNDSNATTILSNQCDIWSKVKQSNLMNETIEYECHFDKKYYDLTMVNDWELICDRAFMAGLTQTLYMIGTVCGLFIGFFSDKYGRQRCSLFLAIMTSTVLIISEVLQLKIFGLSNNVLYVFYSIGQFLIGALAKALYAVVYILVLELTTSKYTSHVSNVYLYMYVFGEFLVLGIAYFFRNWHVMNWFMAGYSFVLVFVIWFLIPESPRYLISVRKTDKALILLRRIAKYNGKENCLDLKESIVLESLVVSEDNQPSNEVIDKNAIVEEKRNKLHMLWKPRENLIKTCLFIYIWFALALIYYGVSLGITSLDDELDPYLMYMLSSFAEIIGYTLCYLNDKFGRKRMMIIFLVSCGAVCLIVALLPSVSNKGGSLSWSSILKIIFASAGKASASAAFNSCYIYNSLLYPTNVRTTIVLFASNIGRVGSYISPQINLLQKLVWQPLPYIIFSGSAILASISVFLLPDPDKIKFL